LFNFKAINIGKEVLLNWSTASENNNDYFVVEHCIDEITFHEIGRVDGEGNSTVIHSYDYLHISPNEGNNYYRLKQVDFEETFTYSDIISVFIKKDIVLEVYPIPVNEVLSIVVGTEGVFNGIVHLISVDGKVIRQLPLAHNQARLDIDIANFPPGIYFVEFTSDRINEIRKIVVE